MASKARLNSSGWNGAPPTAVAASDPKTTGMVEAGKAKGRVAISHLRQVGGTGVVGVGAFIFL